jgi:pimeloyl-ACP methyl ester carboxylesterase
VGNIQSQVRIEREFIPVGQARLHYLKAGNGRPLLLLHGLVGSSGNWTRNMLALAEHATVYALDLPNMGESDRDHNFEASLESIADRIIAFMDAIGLETADVAGHSHGGAVAMMLAARHPERIGRLVLFAPANPYCSLGLQLINFYRSRFGLWLAHQIPWIPRSVKWIALRRMYGDPSRLSKDTLDGYIHGLAVPGTIDYILRILHGWEDGMERLRVSLDLLAEKPILMIWGDRDQTVGLSSAKHLKENFRCSSLMVIPGVGHIPFQEMPDSCNRAVLNWLSSAQAA